MLKMAQFAKITLDKEEKGTLMYPEKKDERMNWDNEQVAGLERRSFRMALLGLVNLWLAVAFIMLAQNLIMAKIAVIVACIWGATLGITFIDFERLVKDDTPHD